MHKRNKFLKNEITELLVLLSFNCVAFPGFLHIERVVEVVNRLTETLKQQEPLIFSIDKLSQSSVNIEIRGKVIYHNFWNFITL